MAAYFKCGRLDYGKCQAIMDKLDRAGRPLVKRIGHNTVLEVFYDENGAAAFAVRYWSTRILRFYTDRTVLHSGGYRTPTTKARLSALGPVYVEQRKGEWFAHGADVPGAPFEDGLTIYHRAPTDTKEALQRAARQGDSVARAALADYLAETA